jgi:undecaprenyl-diphosphatase
MAFNIIIQLGAILAVVWEFRCKIFDVVIGLPTQPSARRFTANLLIAFLPAVVLGVIFADLIHHYLFNPITVATALVVGGIIMLWAERRQHEVHADTVDEITWKDALKVGFAQCLAMIPGTSRSGSTIIGGLLFGLSRKPPPSSRSSWPCRPWWVRRCTQASTASCSWRLIFRYLPSAS